MNSDSTRSRRLAWFLVDHRRMVLCLLLAGTLFFALQWRRIRFQYNEREQLPPDHPDMVYLEQFQRTFGDAEILVVALETDDVFTEPFLRYLGRVTSALAGTPGAKGAISLANAQDFESADGDLRARPFLASVPSSPGELAESRRRALGNRHWVGNLVAADATLATVNIFLDPLTENITRRAEAVDFVRRTLAENPLPGVQTHVTGVSPLVADALACIRRDMMRYLWLTPLVMGALLLALFRSWWAVLIPTLVIGITVIWSFGVYLLAGNAVSPAATMMPTLVALAALSDVIHVMTHYFRTARDCASRREALARSMEQMFAACFLTSATTAAGFASMATSHIRQLREFGIWTGVAVMVAYVVVAAAMPVFLSLIPGRHLRSRPSITGGRSERVFGLLEQVAVRRRGVVLLLTVLVTTMAVGGILRLRIEARLTAHLPRSAPSLRALELVENRMAGVQNLEVALYGAPGTFAEPWALREVDKLARYAARLPGVTQVTALSGVLAEMHGLLAPGGTASGLPQTRQEAAEYLLILSMADGGPASGRLVTPDYAAARVSLRMKLLKSGETLEVVRRVEAYARGRTDPRLTVRTTGLAKLVATQTPILVRSQLVSIGICVGVIALTLALFLRSALGGALCVPSNVVPVLLTLGFVGWARIELSVLTVMVAAIALGLVVDNTIHFFAAYRRETLRTGDMDLALRATLEKTGRAMVIMSLVIAGGFVVFMLSEFGANRRFGLLMALSIVSALPANLVLLPVLVRMTRFR